ncbi:MAG: TatD family hydrolase [bacterium]|nr:TatD family hydrolase [bacterium]
MLIDTHCHLNFRAFKDDADETIRRSLDNDIWVINVGSQLETSQRAIELAEKYPEGVYAVVGLHPIHVTGSLMKNKLDPEELIVQEGMKEFNIDDYRRLAASPKVVAIGEIGLDYYYKPKTKIRLEEFKYLQKQVLLEQIDLAKELNLPIAFHCRSAHGDLIEILKTQKAKGVIHCFTGTWPQAQEYLNMELYLGFNGIIFKQIAGIDWQEIITKTPLEKILMETDAPYLGKSANLRNEPLFVKEVVKEIAKIKNLSYQEVSEITTQNAKKLFNL